MKDHVFAFYSVSFVLIIAMSMMGCTGSQTSALSGQQASRGPINGQQLFEENCASCHGLSGQGHPAMGTSMFHFNDAKWQQMRTDEQIRNTILHGRGSMPAFQGALSEQEVNAIVAHVRTLATVEKE